MSLSEYNLPIFDSKLEAVGKSERTDVLRIIDTRKYSSLSLSYVVKIRTQHSPRLQGESDNQYFLRRHNDSILFIKKEKMMQTTVERILKEWSPYVKIPKEEWFIYKDTDGYPAPARVQEEIVGQLLRDVDLNKLNDNQLSILISLLKANEKCYHEIGKNIDLLGTKVSDSPLFRLKQLTLGALRYSINIIVDTNGSIVLIDPKLGESSNILGFVKKVRLGIDLRILKIWVAQRKGLTGKQTVGF